MSGAAPLFGGIEAGGTKFVLTVSHDHAQPLATHTIATTSPEATLAAAADWLGRHGPLSALGIATFGPADLDLRSPTWGRITATPKPGWSDCDMVGYFAAQFGVPIGFDTDVNAAALAEYAADDSRPDVLAYITVGTGVGGGLVVNGKTVHGAAHPEMGHIYPRRATDDQQFPGICPFHGDCLEGLASGPAIAARWGAELSALAADHAAHESVAGYLAQLCHSLAAINAAQVIVLGGGVMQTPGLLQRIVQQAERLDGAYLPGRRPQSIG
ncbi:MAG: ROK family protein [Novosphingobium sp.]|jgi:fructokinase